MQEGVSKISQTQNKKQIDKSHTDEEEELKPP
jgi:hypothetical protein